MYDPPAATDRYLLVADETGVHAAAAILETLPAELRVDVIVEVDGPADQVPLQQGPNTSVRWVYRNGEPAGTTTSLLDEVALLDLSSWNDLRVGRRREPGRDGGASLPARRDRPVPGSGLDDRLLAPRGHGPRRRLNL